MYDVWRSLESPVVNPTMVKEAMLKAKEKGDRNASLEEAKSAVLAAIKRSSMKKAPTP
jgi:hypothetical protein